MGRYHRSSYSGDPRWIECKWPGKCETCGAELARGARAFYFPKGKHLYCGACGESHSARFEAEREDEDRYCAGYGV